MKCMRCGVDDVDVHRYTALRILAGGTADEERHYHIAAHTCIVALQVAQERDAALLNFFLEVNRMTREEAIAKFDEHVEWKKHLANSR